MVVHRELDWVEVGAIQDAPELTDDAVLDTVLKWIHSPENLMKTVTHGQVIEQTRPTATTRLFHRCLFPRHDRGETRHERITLFLDQRRVEFLPDETKNPSPETDLGFALSWSGKGEAQGWARDSNDRHALVARHLLKRLRRWCQSFVQGGYEKHYDHDRLVPRSVVDPLYSQLKQKYARWVQLYPVEEVELARKYVFEDLAIAALLIGYWGSRKHERFVDLGCGNGLLVFVLRHEGFQGYGIDLQRRPFWEVLQREAEVEIDLRHQTFRPEQDVIRDAEWVLGNHSDELTPWIPFVAAKAKANFWVLPCCAHEFYGPFQERPRVAGQALVKGRYRRYLQYVQRIAEKCGFDPVEQSAMRIPSTKNICMLAKYCEEQPDPDIEALLQESRNYSKRESFEPKRLEGKAFLGYHGHAGPFLDRE